MTEITAAKVKELREKTDAGIMDCKAALTECAGDMESAVDYLRKKGLAAASKKAGRIAAEGVVACHKSQTHSTLIELNSETDFVARNEKFQQLAVKLVNAAAKFGDDVETFKSSTPAGFNATVAEEIVEGIAIVGENLNLRRIASLEVEKGIVASYVHNCIADNLGKIGVLVTLESDADPKKLETHGKHIAMHIAAARPEALTIENLSPELIDRERRVIREQALESNTKPEIVERMVEGRIAKYYEESVLMEQKFIIDNKTKIKDLLQNISQELGTDVKIGSFVRFALGEGITKKEEE